MNIRHFPVFLLILLMPSCAKLGIGEKKKPAPASQPFGPSGIPPQLRPKGNSSAPTVAQAQVEPTAFTPEDEIVFTDPDNPDAGIPELSSILSKQPEKRGPWEESDTDARRLAAREGKPLLIWFTDSARSPMCKALSQELFSRPDFGSWAENNIVRLRVDENVAASSYVSDRDIGLDEKETRRVDARNHVEKLKKRYKVLGHPFLVMLHPGGEVIGRFRGYKRGEADFLWGQLKHAQTVSVKAQTDWRRKMGEKGYREWQDKQGRKVFARLTGYRNGTLTLIEPDGTRAKTSEFKLSDDDRKWLDEQKRLRGL